ncbi:MAG: hypothetical protein ACR2HR_01090 [Euzebya sp.]
MAHPLITSSKCKALAAASVTGALLLLPALPAVGLSGVAEIVPQTLPACDEMAVDVVDVVDVVGETCEPVQDGVQTVTETVAPVVDTATDLVMPVVEEAASAEVVPPGEGEAPEEPVTPLEDTQDSAAQPTQGGGDAGGEVKAAGTGPVEVLEPKAPAADDGRIATSPGLQPTDLAGLGPNIPGINSRSDLTLQPYDSPLVSIPMQFQATELAGAPVTTSSPVAALAAEAVSFAGDAVLPYASGVAGWVAVAGLSLAVGSVYALRRRDNGLLLAPIDTD